jgi:hypothetical protein
MTNITTSLRRLAVSLRLLACLMFLAVATSWVGGQSAAAQWGYHSSTLEEGIQRGYADVVRSQGMANLLNSQAATQFEQARKSYIENQLKATQTYFEMRRYNTEARRAERSTPLSTEQYVRLARDQAPDSLTPTQLDPLTGTIGWPAALRQPQYAAFRTRLDKLLQDRASGYLVFGEIQKACEEFQAQLKADLPNFSANDYVAAKKFLDSLAFAARGVQS